MRKFLIAGLALGAAAIVALVALKGDGPGETSVDPVERKELPGGHSAVPVKETARRAGDAGGVRGGGSAADAAGETSEEADDAEGQSEEEKREAAEEALVEAFDDLTDKWQEPSAKGVTMADVDNFVNSFRKIPKARHDECIHRALNLIPDENVMLLAGILMDKTADAEIVETVYNDILNRDEDVKKPILQQIFKDKTHPCWADTAWILDVTGELPRK